MDVVDTTITEAGLTAVRLAGNVLKEHFGEDQRISFKGEIDLVTETDHRAEEAAVSYLNAAFPDHGILAEERSEVPSRSACRWILDPLDGTLNYAHGYPFFAVSLAFEYDAVIEWGAVYDPIRQELFTARRGTGAFLNGKPVGVSSTGEISRSMLCTGFPYDVHNSPRNNLDHFEKFIRVAQALRRDGAAALDLCYVATGRFDGFWEMKLKPWDLAAGCLIAGEAGGRVTDFAGGPFDMNAGEILASNALIHRDMVTILSEGRASAG